MSNEANLNPPVYNVYPSAKENNDQTLDWNISSAEDLSMNTAVFNSLGQQRLTHVGHELLRAAHVILSRFA